MRANNQRYDVVVVGGGPAGLGGALALARARRRVLVVDAGDPRNAPAAHVHQYLGREGTAPQELTAIGRREVEQYGGVVLRDRVTALRRESAGFVAELASGSPVRARRVLVATGLTDELPDVPGLAEGWGDWVVHCPYCHGWELRDQPIGVVGSPAAGPFLALLWRQWSRDVVWFRHTAAEADTAEVRQLTARGVRIVDGPLTRVEHGDGRVAVHTGDGATIERRALVVAPRFTASDGLLTGLGIEAVEQELHGAVRGTRVPTDPTGMTSVPGVWVAGNVGDIGAQVMASAVQATAAAAAINVDLVVEDTAAAVQGAGTHA